MKVDLFDFHLPDELIAQTPLENRADSRLMVLNKETGETTDEQFKNFSQYLNEGDCLVLNDTRVLPARLLGVKEETGAKVEVLLLKQAENDEWETLVKPAKRIRIGNMIQFGDGLLKAVCTGETDHGGRILQFSYDGIFYEIIDKLGKMPLPPYIKEQLDNSERYQTVFAKERGSAAAPTAGLHFTPELLQELKDKGVKIAFITLHVGLGTFRPVSVTDLRNHEMHAEYYEMSAETAAILNETKKNGGRIVTVGTTSTRTIETIASNNNRQFEQSSGWTDIFIYPGYDFKAVDGMLTNFHLPKSTLIMLISAFSNRDYILKAYEEAVAKRYRFFSFGDAMLLT